jgi:hypothetical protein
MTDDKGQQDGEGVIPAYRYEQLDKAHKNAIGKLTELEKQVEKFKGIDPQEFFALKSAADQAEKDKALKSPDKLEEHWNKKFLDARKEWDGKLSTYEQENQQLKNQIRNLKITDKVMLEVGPLFNPDTHRWIKSEVERRADLDQDGNLVFKDETGEVMFSPTRRTEPLSIKEFGAILVGEFPSAAKPTSGGGSADMTKGNRTNGHHSRVPTTLEELNAMPNPRDTLAKMSAEDRNILMKNTRL